MKKTKVLALILALTMALSLAAGISVSATGTSDLKGNSTFVQYTGKNSTTPTDIKNLEYYTSGTDYVSPTDLLNGIVHKPVTAAIDFKEEDFVGEAHIILQDKDKGTYTFVKIGDKWMILQKENNIIKCLNVINGELILTQVYPNDSGADILQWLNNLSNNSHITTPSIDALMKNANYLWTYNNGMFYVKESFSLVRFFYDFKVNTKTYLAVNDEGDLFAAQFVPSVVPVFYQKRDCNVGKKENTSNTNLDLNDYMYVADKVEYNKDGEYPKEVYTHSLVCEECGAVAGKGYCCLHENNEYHTCKLCNRYVAEELGFEFIRVEAIKKSINFPLFSRWFEPYEFWYVSVENKLTSGEAGYQIVTTSLDGKNWYYMKNLFVQKLDDCDPIFVKVNYNGKTQITK